jgi:chorismate dehydratase
MTSKIRVGRIGYSNILPVYHFLDQEEGSHLFEFVPAVPTQLNEMLAKGDVVAGPISAFSYAEHADQYYAMSDLSVSSRGPVGSIFLFAKRPMDDLNGKTVALTSTSASSVNLLKILLQEYCGVTPVYKTQPPHLHQMMESAEAALLIGDDALYWSLQDHPYTVYDLGAEWHRRTGHSMTFAIWAIRKDFVRQYPEHASVLHRMFLNSKRKGLAHLDQVIAEAIRLNGQNYDFWKSYFDKLIHDFAGNLVTGAEAYFEAAYHLGLLSRPVRIELWGANE